MPVKRRAALRKPKRPVNTTSTLDAQPRRQGTSKNQTAVERKTQGEALTRKVCAKCGQPIRQKDLLHVQTLFGRNGDFADSITPYHRSCWGGQV